MKLRLLVYSFCQQAQVTAPPLIKRFYKTASVEKSYNLPHPMHQWIVKLDGKSTRTASRHVLAVPTPQLASFIAHELNMQGEVLRPTTMPLMTMSKHAIDMDHDELIREMMEKSIVNFLERDTLLYREEVGSKLYARQATLLDPVLKEFNGRFQLQLKTNFGLEVTPLRLQDKMRIESLIQPMNNWQLVCLDQIVDNLKSCILALQVWDNLMPVEEAVRLSRLEEDFQIEKFGKVEGHHDYDENTVLMNTSAAKLFQQLLQSQSMAY